MSHNRISRFTANGDVAAAGSEVVLVDLPNLSGATNHNGGGMHFGSDGKLYVGVGENANGAQAQNLALPFGKLLRFNEDGSDPDRQPVLRDADRPRPRGLGLRPAQSVHLRGPAGHRPDPHQRRRRDDLGRDRRRQRPAPTTAGPARKGPTTSAPASPRRSSPTSTADAAPPGSGPGGFFKGFAIAGGAFYPATGAFPDGYRDQYYFADFVSRFVGRIDLANGNAAYAFAELSAASRSTCSSAATARSTC